MYQRFVLGLQKIWQFSIVIKNEVEIDATGMYIPIRLISSLLAWNEFGVLAYTCVESVLLVLLRWAMPDASANRTSRDIGSPLFFL